ncbi:MAG: GntR family transcriptional regulator [Beutenbergiaceae bacterium]
MSQTIERTSPVPYYEQLFAILRDRILSLQIPQDERLPSELELCREFGLSRATVRQTLAKLESEGLARRIPRRGVFAGPPPPSTGWTVHEGFLESQLRHGQSGIETRVVDARHSSAPAHVTDAFNVDSSAELFLLERVRSLHGNVAMFSTNWFPPEVGAAISTAEEVLDGSASLNETLRAAGYATSGAHRVLHAITAPDFVAEHLQITSSEPVLRVRSLSWDSNDLKFDYYETWVLTDTIPLEVNVSAS